MQREVNEDNGKTYDNAVSALGKYIIYQGNNSNDCLNMGKQIIKMTESDLHQIIKESVNRILTELDWKTYANAARKADERAMDIARKPENAHLAVYQYNDDNKKNYEILHPTGPKHDYCYHTEAMDRAMEAKNCSAEDMKISLLSCIADSLADIADNLSEKTRPEDRSDIMLANLICERVRKCTDAETAMIEIAFELEKVLEKPLGREFYNFKNEK